MSHNVGVPEDVTLIDGHLLDVTMKGGPKQFACVCFCEECATDDPVRCICPDCLCEKVVPDN